MENKQEITISLEEYEHLKKLQRFVYNWHPSYSVCPKCGAYKPIYNICLECCENFKTT